MEVSRNESEAHLAAQNEHIVTHAGVPELNFKFQTDCRGASYGDSIPATHQGT